MLEQLAAIASTAGVFIAALSALLSVWVSYRTQRIVQNEMRQLRTKEGLSPATKSEEEVNSSAKIDAGAEDE